MLNIVGVKHVLVHRLLAALQHFRQRDHAVLDALVPPVAQDLKRVADVNHDGAVDRRDVNPRVAVQFPNVEPADLVLEEDGERGDVGVTADADGELRVGTFGRFIPTGQRPKRGSFLVGNVEQTEKIFPLQSFLSVGSKAGAISHIIGGRIILGMLVLLLRWQPEEPVSRRLNLFKNLKGNSMIHNLEEPPLLRRLTDQITHLRITPPLRQVNDRNSVVDDDRAGGDPLLRRLNVLFGKRLKPHVGKTLDAVAFVDNKVGDVGEN
nr:hypothetical protein Iba_chr08aCG2320 [Ipomoea batatas]